MSATSSLGLCTDGADQALDCGLGSVFCGAFRRCAFMRGRRSDGTLHIPFLPDLVLHFSAESVAPSP